MTSSDNLYNRIRAAPDDEAAARLLVEADRERQTMSDADPLRRPIDLTVARIVVRNLRAGKVVRWS